MLALAIISTIICALSTSGCFINMGKADGCAEIFGDLIAAAIEAFPIIAIWVMYAKI